MTSLLIGSMTRYGQGYSFLRTRILFSYCIYILAFSKRGTSFLLSPSPAVSIASRTSVLYCSKGASLYPEGDITRDSLMEAGLSIAAGKINSIVPKDGLKLGTCNTGGSDSLGFSSSLSSQGFRLNTQIIFGSNAIEHGVNLIEERTQKVLLVSGWNGARLDPILWELEPRGFKLDLCSVVDEPSFEGVRKIVVAALRSDCGAIIAMGCGSVMESAKLATMLINHRYCDDLVDMSPAELENLLLSTSAEEIDEKGGDDSKDKILLVTVPALPSFGAELSDIVSIRRHADASRTATHYTPAVSPDASSFSSQQSVNVDAGVSTGNKARAGTGIHKHYVRSMHPDLTLVQPSLTYRAPMEMIHDRLLALIATSIDIILSDPGFMPELLAWDALRELIRLFDKAIECAEDRFTQWTLNPDSYEKQTVHDDESDHRSQQFRRYGHGFEMSDIENLCRVGISIASAKNGMRVCGLQYLSDSLGLMGGSSGGHTTRVGKLLPHYLTTIQRWCESDNAVYDNENENDNNNIIKSQDETSATRFRGGRETAGKNDPYKAFIRTKLDKISMIFQNSKYISHQLGDSKVGNIVSKDIIGETCGQIMPSPTATDTATATTGSADPGPVDAMLITQMNNLKNNFRLLAGPLGEEEEKDISVSGDSLTTLRKKVRARTDEEKNRMRRSPFNPLNFEKEEKIKAVISDYISDTESSPFTTGSALEEPGTRPGTGTSGKSRRNLPAVAISDMECYELRLHMKAVCGKSPITLISVPKLKELFSIGYSDTIVEKHVSVVIKNSRSDIGDNVNSKVISDSISSSENSSSASTDSLTQCVEQDPESVHSIPLPLQLSVPMVGVLPVDPLINISDNDDDDTDDNGDIDTDDDDEVALKSNSNSNSAGVTVPFDDTFNAAKSDLIRLSRTVRASRTIESSVESNNDKIEYTDIPIKEAKANIIETPLVTSETEAASETRNIEIVKPVPLKIPSKAKDPAAAHRLKVKRMLAELNSMDIVKDEDKIGGVKEVLVRSEGKETKETKETKGKDLAPKADAGDAALIERQTDVLARLLEQRIHDRWAQAALESVQPNPFNKTNLNK